MCPLLADPFLHSYEADYIADLIQKKEHRLARSFDLRFRYINGEQSLCLKSTIKGTTDTTKQALYLLLLVEIDGKGKIMTKLYDKPDDFSFRIVNFQILFPNLRMDVWYHNITP